MVGYCRVGYCRLGNCRVGNCRVGKCPGGKVSSGKMSVNRFSFNHRHMACFLSRTVTYCLTQLIYLIVVVLSYGAVTLVKSSVLN